jgi:hypothetical protein
VKQQLANLKASGDYARIMREVERETVNGSCRGGLCRARVASHSDARCPQHLSPKPWLWRTGTPVPRRSRFVPTLEIPLSADAALLQTPSPVSLGKQRSMQASRSAEQGSILVDCLMRGKQEAAGSIARVAAPDIEELIIAALRHQVDDIDRQVVPCQTSPLGNLVTAISWLCRSSASCCARDISTSRSGAALSGARKLRRHRGHGRRRLRDRRRSRRAHLVDAELLGDRKEQRPEENDRRDALARADGRLDSLAGLHLHGR